MLLLLHSRSRGSAHDHSLLQPQVPERCCHIFQPHTKDLRLAGHELQSPNSCSLGTVSPWPQPETWCSTLCSTNVKSSQESIKHFLIIHVHMKVCLFCRMSTYILCQPVSLFSTCVPLTGICKQLFSCLSTYSNQDLIMESLFSFEIFPSRKASGKFILITFECNPTENKWRE